MNSGKISIGRSTACNIVINDDTISRVHAEMWADNGHYIYNDTSSNGSIIGGMVVRNSSRKVPPGTRILLANKIPLPWERVFELLPMPQGVGGNSETIAFSPGPSPATPVRQDDSSGPDRLTIGWGILAFLVPIAGWVMYTVWHEKTPNRAAAAGVIGTISFILGIISLL